MFLTALVFIIILSILVFVHEFGHFIVAKRSGIRVEEFGFGLPPRLWGKKKGETIYSINALPIGGFVKLYGEDDPTVAESKGKDSAFSFAHKPIWQRMMVVTAGVTMNFLLAIVVFSFVYAQTGIPTQTEKIRILATVPGSPAAESGLAENDIILKANGQTLASTQQFTDLARQKAGQEMELEVKREKDNPCLKPAEKQIVCRGGNLVLKVTPRGNPPSGEGPFGVVISNVEMKFYPPWEMPIRSAYEGLKESFGWSKLIISSLGTMVIQLFAGEVPKDVAGPVGIFQLTGQVARIGLLPIMQFLGILSINLAIINILPFPALDGGRLLFMVIEAVSGRKVKAKVEASAHQIGMVLLLTLIILVTLNDLKRISAVSELLESLRRLFPF